MARSAPVDNCPLSPRPVPQAGTASTQQRHLRHGEALVRVGLAVWPVRGGRHGERERTCLGQDLIIVGWRNIGDIADYRTREELQRRVRAAYPDVGKRRVSDWTGQLWRFARTIRAGDHVVLPLKTFSKSSPKVEGGCAIGEYRHQAP